MKSTRRLNAKKPYIAFEEDSRREQIKAIPAIREAAEKFLGPVYDKLETARAGQASR